MRVCSKWCILDLELDLARTGVAVDIMATMDIADTVVAVDIMAAVGITVAVGSLVVMDSQVAYLVFR